MVSTLVLIYFNRTRLGHTIKTNCIKFQISVDLSFEFLEKGLGLVSPPRFVYHFLRKTFVILSSINWPNLIAWLTVLPEILGDMCILVVCFAVHNVINLKLNLAFLSSCFSVWLKRSGLKFKYLKNEKSF